MTIKNTSLETNYNNLTLATQTLANDVQKTQTSLSQGSLQSDEMLALLEKANDVYQANFIPFQENHYPSYCQTSLSEEQKQAFTASKKELLDQFHATNNIWIQYKRKRSTTQGIKEKFTDNKIKENFKKNMHFLERASYIKPNRTYTHYSSGMGDVSTFLTGLLVGGLFF